MLEWVQLILWLKINNMSKLNFHKIGSIIFTTGAVVSLVLAILGNDRLINLVFIFATAGIILSTTDKSSYSAESSKNEKSPNKLILWISILLIIVGIIFAVII